MAYLVHVEAIATQQRDSDDDSFFCGGACFRANGAYINMQLVKPMTSARMHAEKKAKTWQRRMGRLVRRPALFLSLQ